MKMGNNKISIMQQQIQTNIRQQQTGNTTTQKHKHKQKYIQQIKHQKQIKQKQTIQPIKYLYTGRDTYKQSNTTKITT
jgi:hypothetical protein